MTSFIQKIRATRTNRGRKAVASVIGGVVVFAILFSVGFAYFMTVQQDYKTLQSNANQSLQENLLVTGSANSSGVYVNVNSTGTTATIIAYQIIDLGGNYGALLYNNTGRANNPIAIVPQGLGKFLPGHCTLTTCSSGHYLIKVVTLRGNVFTGVYPPLITSQSLNSLAAGAIGDLYMSFSTFTYYNVTTSGCPTPVPTGGSSYCLQTSAGKSGFTIPSSVATTQKLAFSVVITDYNPSQYNITIDQYSLLEEFLVKGQAVQPWIWYIVSNSSRTILQYDSPLTLKYGVPTLLLFAESGSAGADCASGGAFCSGAYAPLQGTCSGSQGLCSGYTAPVFIVTHGCKNFALSACTIQTANYGQNSPYVTMLYT